MDSCLKTLSASINLAVFLILFFRFDFEIPVLSFYICIMLFFVFPLSYGVDEVHVSNCTEDMLIICLTFLFIY